MVIAKTGNIGFTTSLIFDNHVLKADEPKEAGGDDLGPSPHELLASSLAACTSMTLQMYARRKEWDLQEAQTKVQIKKVSNENGKSTFFEIDLELIGNLDEKQKERLTIIASKCPVHKTLESEINFKINLA